MFSYQQKDLPIPKAEYLFDEKIQDKMCECLSALKESDPKGFNQLVHYDMVRDKSLWTRICLPHKVIRIPDFHYDLYNIHDRISGKQNTLDIVIAIIFRSGAKSSIKVFSVIHNLCYHLEPLQVLLSESEGQAEKDILELEDEFENNKILELLYGKITGKGLTDKFTNTCFETISGEYVEGCGWRTRVRGIKWKGRRPTIVFPDDFESETNTETKESREKIIKWMLAQVLPLGGKYFKIFMTGTIVHPDSFLSQMQDFYEKGIAPFDDERTLYYERAISQGLDGSNPTWIDLYDTDWINKKRKFYKSLNKEYFFLQEYYNLPGVSDQVRFDMSKLVEIDVTLHNREKFLWLEQKGSPFLHVYTYSGTDPASTVTATSDELCHFTLCITPTDFALILDIELKKVKIEDQPQLVHDLNWLYKVRQNTIETYGYQLALEQYVKKIMIDKKQHYIVNTFNENKSKSKKYIVGILPRWNNSQIGYIKGCRNIKVLKSQARKFRGKRSDKDDALDGLFLALQKVIKPPNINVEKSLERLRKTSDNKTKQGTQWHRH